MPTRVSRQRLEAASVHDVCSDGHRSARACRAATVPAPYATQLTDLLLEVRRNASFIGAYDSQPMPWCYYHYMSLIVFIVASLQTIDNAAAVVVHDAHCCPSCTHPDANLTWNAMWNATATDAAADASAGGACVSGGIWWVWVAYHGLMQTAYTACVLGAHELTQALSDPFTSGRNAIPRYKYLDAHLKRDSEHAGYHADLPPSQQDPGFCDAHEQLEPLAPHMTRVSGQIRSPSTRPPLALALAWPSPGPPRAATHTCAARALLCCRLISCTSRVQ
jgi:hypothetical protein